MHVTTVLGERHFETIRQRHINLYTQHFARPIIREQNILLSSINRDGRGAILNAQESHARDLHPEVERE